MEEIQCGFVHEALTAIEGAEEGAYLDLDYRVVAYLKEKGLVSAYSTWFYQEMLSSAAELEKLRKRHKETQDEVTGYESDIKQLEKNLKATWAYNPKELQDMKVLLEEKRAKHAEISRRAEKLGPKVEKLGAMPEPGDYRLTIDGDYVMLTEKGSDWMKIFPGRLQRLWNVPLEVFEQEIGEFESRIEVCYSRFTEMLDLMASRGFGKRSQQVIHCAALLSTAEGTIPWLYSRMKVISDYLSNDSSHHEGLKGYTRLFPAVEVAMQPGDIATLAEELIRTYNALVEKNYLKNSFTWWLASAVMALQRFDVEKTLNSVERPSNFGLEENIERYEGLKKAVAKKDEDWTRHTCYMAVNLARQHDSPEELAKELRTQQQRLASTGRTDGMDLGTASLILLDSGLSLEERTDRFLKTFEDMAASGWEKHSHFYPAAAALTLLPGSAAENVMWLGRIIKRLKADGFADETVTRAGHKDGLTYRALPLLLAAYRDQFSQEVTPRTIVHSEDSFFKY